jgi:hypothetical protein
LGISRPLRCRWKNHTLNSGTSVGVELEPCNFEI